jgi:hypothetical protein
MRRLGPFLLTASALLAACGQSSSSSLPDGFYIGIVNMNFSPLDLAAPPGVTGTITISASAMPGPPPSSGSSSGGGGSGSGGGGGGGTYGY